MAHTGRMAGNFRGVLIFIIFVVDLAVTKFSHPKKLMPTVIWYCVSPWWWAWPQTSWQHGRHFPVLASNSSHYHPADSVFNTNINSSHVPRLVAVTKFKTMKINFEVPFGLFTKYRPYENYPPYGNWSMKIMTPALVVLSLEGRIN